MGRYLDMLLARDANLQKPQTGNLQNQQNPEPYPDKGGSVGFEGTPPGTSQNFTHAKCDPAIPPAIAQKPPIPARAPLVTPDDLYRVQRPLLAHLTHCRACIVDLHRYCQAIEREANGYEAFLAEFPDMEQRHQDFVGEVIRARHAVFVRSVH